MSQAFDFQGSAAAVTGAASGIGRALALELAARGCDLALADIDDTGLESVAKEVKDAQRRCRRSESGRRLCEGRDCRLSWPYRGHQQCGRRFAGTIRGVRSCADGLGDGHQFLGCGLRYARIFAAPSAAASGAHRQCLERFCNNRACRTICVLRLEVRGAGIFRVPASRAVDEQQPRAVVGCVSGRCQDEPCPPGTRRRSCA